MPKRLADDVARRVRALIEEQQLEAGMRLPAERQLAGFFDRPGARLSESVDGPSAAPETLRGAHQAQHSGWTAPAMPDEAPIPPLPEKE